MAGRNVVEYEFQGNILPLEQAFAKVSSLFRKYVKEAKAANVDNKLTPDQKDLEKTFKNLSARLTALKDKQSGGTKLSDEEIKETERLYKRLLQLASQFKKQKDKILKENNRKAEKEAREKESSTDYLSTASQFKAGVQVEQLQDYMNAIPTLPAEVVSDLNAYIEAWKQASEGYKNGTVSSDALSDATQALDDKTKEYAGTLKLLQHEQKTASNAGELMLQGIIRQISSFETWFRWIKEGITYLADYIESINFVEVALSNIDFSSYTDSVEIATEATNEFTEALEEARWALGLDATDLNEAAAIFVSFANAIGMTGETVLEFSENITQLSVDMASLYNKDVTTVATALKSALAGNTRALMNYGISVHDATLNEWLLSKGINKTMTDLSETSQAMVRYAYIVEKTSGAQGDLARTLKSPSNQLKVLKNQVKLLLQNLGSLFNTVLYPAIRILNELLIPLNAFMTSLTSIANSNYSSSIGTMTDQTDDLTDSLNEASDAAVGLTGLDEINQKTEVSTTATGVDPDIQGLIDGLGVYEGFAGTTSKLTELMKSLGEALAPVWSMFSNTNVIDALTASIDFLMNAFVPLQKLLESIKSGFDNSPEWLQTILSILLEIGGTLVSLATTIGIVTAALAIFKTLTASETFTTFLVTLKSMWTGFLTLGKTIYAAIAKFITWIATMIKARIESLKATIQTQGLGAALLSVAKSALTAMLSLIKYIAKLILAGAKAVFTAIKNLILSKSLWGVALGAIAAAGVAALAVAAVVGIAVAIGAATQSSNEATESTIGLATGGVATGPTFAMIGEGKYDEAVIPLGSSPQFQSMKEGIASEVISKIDSSSGSSSSSSRPIILTINGKELARTILPDIKQALPQTGMRLAR